MESSWEVLASIRCVGSYERGFDNIGSLFAGCYLLPRTVTGRLGVITGLVCSWGELAYGGNCDCFQDATSGVFSWIAVV